MEEKLKKYIKEENVSETKTNDSLDNNFDIKLKEHPIHELAFHTGSVFCLTLLKDGRMVSVWWLFYNNI